MAEHNDKPIDDTNPPAGGDSPPAETSFRAEGDLSGEDVTFASDADDDADQHASQQGSADNAASSSTAQTLKDGAAKLTQTVTDRAKTYAEDGKARAHGALDELATMLQDAAGTVDEKIGEQYGQYARTAADAVTGFSDQIKAKNVDDLIADATSFVKKSPAIAIGTAAAIGFVLVRLVQSGLNADTSDQA